jgi:hypothetical protein
MIAITLMLCGAMFGFAYGVLSYALPFAPDMDVFTSTGIGLGAGASFLVIALQLALAPGRFAFAILMLFAPFASWIVALITDPLGTKARARHRARIDVVYPPPDLRERRFYAET